MTDLRRTLRCSNCNNEATLNINSELDLRELILAGKCSRCGSAMQINYSVVEKTPASSGSAQTSQASSDPSTQMVNIDDALTIPDMPSETLRDIMED